MKYQRFVSYIYEYRKGKKESNCGFLKVELRDEMITIEIHMKCQGLPSDEKCSIYGFLREADKMEGVLLGQACSEREKLNCMLETSQMEEDSWKKEFLNFGGMVILTENGAFFGTEWDDRIIRPENFEVRKEKTKNREENVEAESFLMPQATTKKELENETETELEIEDETEKKMTNCIFYDDKITNCHLVHPNDFFKNYPAACRLKNNRFLNHGFYQFGHLLVGNTEDDQQILGVPGRFDQQEQFMANMFGFPFFKESCNIQVPGGRGGYWCRLINSANFHERDMFDKD